MMIRIDIMDFLETWKKYLTDLINMTNLTLIRTNTSAPEIRQSRMKRDWMDNTYNKHAYRCLPLSSANVNGWEIILEKEVRVIWDGYNCIPKILNKDSNGTTLYNNDRIIATCNKVGMVDFGLSWIFKTDPGYETWLMGSPNYFIEGASPLSAILPSSWWPDEAQFNWRIDKEGQEVVFPEGMPFAFFFVYKNELEDVSISVENYWDNQKLMEERIAYGEAKNQKTQEQPWTWMNGIRTGLNEKGERIGPRHDRHIMLSEPIVKPIV